MALTTILVGEDEEQIEGVSQELEENASSLLVGDRILLTTDRSDEKPRLFRVSLRQWEQRLYQASGYRGQYGLVLAIHVREMNAL